MLAAVITVSLAFVGYVFTHVHSVALARRAERLARVNRQLSELYGPLLALTETNNRAYHVFAERHPGPDGPPVPDERPPTDADLAEWRLWMDTVFLPNARLMRDILVTKADLLAESSMPEVLLAVYTHVSWNEITAARWERGEDAPDPLPTPFPATAIRSYARESFDRLKGEQAKLLGRRRT